MFLLDTNILSAVHGYTAGPQVASWMEEQPPDLFVHRRRVPGNEILSGIAVLPTGRRREALEMAALAIVREDFAGRILPFDTDVAVIYAELFALRRSAGRPAAICRSNDCLNCPRVWLQRRHARHGGISRAVAWRWSIRGRLHDKRQARRAENRAHD